MTKLGALAQGQDEQSSDKMEIPSSGRIGSAGLALAQAKLSAQAWWDVWWGSSWSLRTSTLQARVAAVGTRMYLQAAPFTTGLTYIICWLEP